MNIKKLTDEKVLDELYYPVYDMNGKNQKLIRNARKYFKEEQLKIVYIFD